MASVREAREWVTLSYLHPWCLAFTKKKQEHDTRKVMGVP